MMKSKPEVRPSIKVTIGDDRAYPRQVLEGIQILYTILQMD
jgi:hypothetical protein